MTILLRPDKGRIVAGVARGLAEQYKLNVFLTRAVMLTAILAQPFGLFVYLLLWISIPSELSVLGELRMGATNDGNQRSHFEQFASILLHRTGVTSVRRVIGKQFFAFVMLVVAFIFELPRLEGMNFYYLHPYLSTFYSGIERHAAALFYLSVAFAFFAIDRLPEASVQRTSEPASEVLLDRSETREIGGLIGGLSRVIGIEPAYLRVIVVVLNILTFGIVGLAYLVAVWILSRKGKYYEQEHTDSSFVVKPTTLSTPVRMIVGVFFLLLALIRITTEFRIFFFNEPFFRGIVLSIVGLIFAVRSLRHVHKNTLERLWLLLGSVILFCGVYDLASAVFRVQPSFSAQFEIAFLISGLAFLYFAVVGLTPQKFKFGLLIAAVFFVSAAIIQLDIAPNRFLMAIVEFYDFFYPVIFAGFGLWIVIER